MADSLNTRPSEVKNVDFSMFKTEFNEETISLLTDVTLYKKIENYLKYRKLL